MTRPGTLSIKLLPEELVNKIAAGEVIERPASVVKELVENALDAGATRITVEVQDIGRRSIRVADNGCGLTKDEIGLAVQRHATSKIARLEDLFNIQTLGFRGEALPAIASVSRLTIEPNPSRHGVTVKVKDLFYNTPARKKFLKSPATEMGHIGEVVAKYALANSRVAFELIADGKPLLSTGGSGQLEDAVLSVYGLEVVKSLVPVDRRFKHGRVRGLVSRPTISRLDRSYLTFYVNGRHIKHFLLNRALEEAYRTLIPNNRYPIALLFLEIDPRQVDVNVHPTKREVKFADNQAVMEAVREAAREALGTGSQDKGSEAGIEAGHGNWSTGVDPHDQLLISDFDPGLQTQNLMTSFESADLPLTPLYQLKNTYLVCAEEQGLVLVDQHAAHERILYDQLCSRDQVAGSQGLLTPETLEFEVKEATVLMDNIDNLKGLGFELDEFGNNSFLLRAVPAAAGKGSIKQLLQDIIAELKELGRSAQAEVKQETLRKLVACHGAIKAGDPLSGAEIRELLKGLFRTAHPLTCPHGRPTMIRIGEAELQKRFGR